MATHPAAARTRLTRRHLLRAGGVLLVGWTLRPTAASAQAPGPDQYLGKTVASDAVDGFLAIHPDGAVTVFSGKVDLGTGIRAGIMQMAAEELDVTIGRLTIVDGDTALTPDQGGTGGSSTIVRGGVQIRQAAATARQALLRLAAERLGHPVEDLEVADGVVRPRSNGASPRTGGVSYGELVGGRRLTLALDPNAPLKDPRAYRIVGTSVPRPDVAAKCTGRHVYVHDVVLPGMLHARVLRPPAVGATLRSVDASSIASIPGARAVRIGGFLAVVADREWSAVRAARMLRAQWSPGRGLPEHDTLWDGIRAARVLGDQTLASRGDLSALAPGATPDGRTLSATYRWPMQSHGSLGPGCAVADVRPDRATIWTASQATHRFRDTYAAMLKLPPERVRLVYLDGAGSYGMNGSDDAACEAALLSRATGRPVRVQWMRHDEHGWDPKGPAQLLDLRAVLGAGGEVQAWETQAWLPAASRGLPNVPLLAPDEAGISQHPGVSTGLISQHLEPPYAVGGVRAVIHWLGDPPLRTSQLRSPGKPGNTFAVESFVDEIAARTSADPLEFRLRRLADPRAVEVLRRLGARMRWDARPSPRKINQAAALLAGRGLSYVHYKDAENYVAMGMEVEVERHSGRIQVTRVVCVHDCGLMINPDGVQNQVEGCIVQTLSRALYEEVGWNRDRVTSLDWQSYPILRFPQAPAIEVELIQRLDQPPLGVGEPASAPVAAALGNAVFDATGVRFRTVPLRAERVKAGLDTKGG
ncbi:MAG TPA: molybdopterin cofactor-binding domain-containing protein [bacterium]|nr:molybdopterin cofactor-binding domain-containing protein [bacterium]